MSDSFDLWNWFAEVHRDGQRHRRAECEIEVRTPDHTATAYSLRLGGCLPIKLKAPDLNAREGGVAIEEIEIAYESMRLEPPGGGRG